MIETLTISQLERLARGYIDRLLLNTLLGVPQPLRVSEILERLGMEQLTSRAVRTLLLTAPELFLQQERRWLPLFRKTPPQTPLLTFLERIVRMMGAPISIQAVAGECSLLYRRSAEYYETILGKVVDHSYSLFCFGDGWIGLREWLFHVEELEPIPYEWEVESERRRAVEDALFYNFLSWESVEPYLEVAQKIDWQTPSASLQFLQQVNQPVPSRLLGFFAWYFTLDPDPHWVYPYNPILPFETVYQSGAYILGSDAQWYPAAIQEQWLQEALRIAQQLEATLLEEEVQPLEIRPEELERLVQHIQAASGIVSAVDLLEQFFEVAPTSKSFRDDLYTLINALWADGRVAWLGYDRFGREELIPDYVRTVPSLLEYPELPPVVNPNTEEPYDVLLAEDAFPRSLQKEMRDPRAQDVLDEEPAAMVPRVPETIRCVLKSHHRELGTFPLCQIPLGFFPDDPNIQALTFLDEKGKAYEVWLNHETRLLYGLLDRFAEVEAFSGAIFTLSKTEHPCLYRLEFTGETDPLMYIPSARYEKLLELQQRAEELSTYQIMVEIMKHYPKGVDYLTLLTEVNVVRRTKRYLIASLLSAYSCFYQHKGSTVWHLDERKVDLPVEKVKRKHLLE